MVACGFLALVVQAPAASSPWVETPGGRVRVLVDDRLVTPIDPATGAIHLRGAVQVELAAGWKTYWKNPGTSGVPPQIFLDETGAFSDAKLLFPTPEHFGEGGDAGIGYKIPVTLPVIFSLHEGQAPERLKGYVFLGICEQICIPVQADFDLDLMQKSAAQAVASRTIIASAFDRLPKMASQDFGIKQVSRKNGNVEFQLSLRDPKAESQLFVASERMTMSEPATTADDASFFSSKIHSEHGQAPILFDYTLVQNGEAVSGQIALP